MYFERENQLKLSNKLKLNTKTNAHTMGGTYFGALPGVQPSSQET